MIVKLDVINPDRKLFYKVALYVFVISLIILFSSIFLLNSRVLLLLLFSIVMISGFIINLTKGVSKIGAIYISKSKIILEIKNNSKIIFDIDSKTKIRFNYSNYEGQRFLNPVSISTEKGLNNFITIINTNSYKTVEISLTKNDLIKINRMVMIWKDHEVDVLIIDSENKILKSINY